MKFNVNTTAIFVQIIAVILSLISLILPHWLTNSTSTIFHPYSRSWGLFTVVGRTIRAHVTQWKIACASVATFYQLNCDNPLCKWYSQKCFAFRLITIISYTVAVCVILSILLTCISILMSLRRSRKLLRISVGLSFLAPFLQAVSIIVYIFGMNEAFTMINSVGYYPVPQPSTSLVLICLSTFILTLSGILHSVQLRAVSRESAYIKQTKSDVQKIRNEYRA